LTVSTNLRLSPEAAAALRETANKTGRSQQELLREAVDQYLGLRRDTLTLERAIASGLVRPPTPFADTTPTARLPQGVSTTDLLDRDEGR
jgi:predicted transcriptional regulator